MAYRTRKDAMALHVHVHDSDALTPPRREVAFASTDEAKNIWIVRHGESEHNSSSDWGLRDPSLTQRGRKQAKALKFHPMLREALGFVNKEQMASLVVVSPLRRALQTAQMVAESMRGQGNSYPWVPIMAHPDLQELTDGPNDTGHPTQVLNVEFPEVDFEQVPEDWFDKRKAGNSMREERMMRFCEWLANRPESGIICIGHLDFFRELMGVSLKNCGAAHYIFANGGWKCQHALPKQKPPPLPPGAPLPSPLLLFTPKTVSAEARKSLLTPSSTVKSVLKGGRAEMYVGEDDENVRVTDNKDPHAEQTAVALFALLVQKNEQPADKHASVVKPSHTAQRAAGKAALAFLDERDPVRPADRVGPSKTAHEEDEGECLERGRLASSLVDMGVPARQAEQLVTHITCTGRARKSVRSLALVTQDDFVTAVAHPKFLRMRLLLAHHLPAPLQLQATSSPSLSHASTANNSAFSSQRFSPSAAKDSLRPLSAGYARPNGGHGYFQSPLSTASSPCSMAPAAGSASAPSTRRNIFHPACQPSASSNGESPSLDKGSQKCLVQPASAQRKHTSSLPWARKGGPHAAKRMESFRSSKPEVCSPDGAPLPAPAQQHTQQPDRAANGASRPSTLLARASFRYGEAHRSNGGQSTLQPDAAAATSPKRPQSALAPGGLSASGLSGEAAWAGRVRRPEEQVEREVLAAEARVAQLSAALREAEEKLAILHTSPNPAQSYGAGQRTRGYSGAY